MKTTKETWFCGKPPTKEEVERMYKLSYTLDREFFKKEDVINLGLDLHRLKEFGEVRLSKTVSVLRKHTPALWGRMNSEQRSAYIIADIFNNLSYVQGAILELEKVLEPLPDAHEGITMISGSLYSRTPQPLRERLKSGFGKWSGAS